MKRINIFKYLSFIMIIALSFSCSNDDDDNKSTSKKEEKGTVYDLDITPKLELSDSSMSKLKKKVFKNLISKKPIKQSDITRLLIKEQVKYYNEDSNVSYKEDTDTVESWVKDLSSGTKDLTNIEDIKVKYQTKKLDMNKMKYNAIATSLPYIMNDKKLQCFSSTMLHQLVLRNNSKFKDMNPVVIYEWGHVLSGYMSKDGNSFKLIGIENTVTGKGIKKYKDLTSNYNGKWIRVVDSELFAILEIFKNDIANINEVAKQALDLTAKKYSLDPSFNYEYSKILDQNNPSSFSSNGSPLAFGEADVTDGDKEIQEADEIAVDNTNTHNHDHYYSDVRVALTRNVRTCSQNIQNGSKISCKTDGMYVSLTNHLRTVESGHFESTCGPDDNGTVVWRFGDGTTSPLKIGEKTYEKAGEFEVKVSCTFREGSQISEITATFPVSVGRGIIEAFRSSKSNLLPSLRILTKNKELEQNIH